MKINIKMVFLTHLVFISICYCSMVANAGIEIVSLRMDRVEMRLNAPVKKLNQQEIEIFIKKARKKVGAESMAYLCGSDSEFYSYIWAFSDKVNEAQKMLEEIAIEPFEKWKITLQVHGGRKETKGEGIRDSDTPKQIKEKREEILEYQIIWRDKVTIGDVLQTLCDNLEIGAVIESSLLDANGNDWKDLLSRPFNVKKTEIIKNLTLDDLIKLLKKQLNATVKLNNYLKFDILEPYIDENLESNESSSKH